MIVIITVKVSGGIIDMLNIQTAIYPDGSLQDCLEWVEIQRKIIYDLREYHLALILFLEDLAHNGPCGSYTPRRPKGDLA